MKRYVIVAVAVLLGCSAASGQRKVISGLEGHTEYRDLVDRERALVHSADSLAGAIASLRHRFRTDTLDREAVSAAIVMMEERDFEIRSAKARLASRINTIEQEWILAALTSPTGGDGGVESVGPGRNSANLVHSSYFETSLSPRQLEELLGAQRAEPDVPRLVAQYRENHSRMAALAREYDLAASRGPADSIRVRFDSLNAAGRVLGERIADAWEAIFDSKNYIYNLLAEKDGDRTLLARLEEGMEGVRRERPRWEEGPAAPLADYVLQKRMLTDYETALAESLGNGAAADSLRGVSEVLPGPEGLDELVPVGLKERLFLDYADVRIGGSPYNTGNPVPEVAVWPRGTIWRILVGNFSTRQPQSVFRGAHPLGVQVGDDKRFRYFAGGFPTDSLALEAVEQLRRAGFRSPSAVVWIDGVYMDPGAAHERVYRMNISGIGELSSEIREVIASAASGGENTGTEGSTGGAPDIVRDRGIFTVTPLDGSAAVRLHTALEALRVSHPEMEIKLTKIAE